MNKVLVGVAIAIGLLILGCGGLLAVGFFINVSGRMSRLDRDIREKLEAEKQREAILSEARSRKDLPVVSAAALGEGYGLNEIRQDGLFKDKPIAVFGYVGAIGKGGDKRAFVMFTSKPVVTCIFAEEQFGDVAKLSRGQTASIAGICTGLRDDLVTLEDCWLYTPGR